MRGPCTALASCAPVSSCPVPPTTARQLHSTPLSTAPVQRHLQPISLHTYPLPPAPASCRCRRPKRTRRPRPTGRLPTLSPTCITGCPCPSVTPRRTGAASLLTWPSWATAGDNAPSHCRPALCTTLDMAFGPFLLSLYLLLPAIAPQLDAQLPASVGAPRPHPRASPPALPVVALVQRAARPPPTPQRAPAPGPPPSSAPGAARPASRSAAAPGRPPCRCGGRTARPGRSAR